MVSTINLWLVHSPTELIPARINDRSHYVSDSSDVASIVYEVPRRSTSVVAGDVIAGSDNSLQQTQQDGAVELTSPEVRASHDSVVSARLSQMRPLVAPVSYSQEAKQEDYSQGTTQDSLSQFAPETNGVRPVQADPIRLLDAVSALRDQAIEAKAEGMMEKLLSTVPSIPDDLRQAVSGEDPSQQAEVLVQPTIASLNSGVQSAGGLVTLAVRDTPLQSVLYLLAQQQGLSVVSPSTLNSSITMTLQPTSLEVALDALMAVSGCTWNRQGNVIYVTPLQKDVESNFFAQGRVVKVFDLSYMSAEDAEKVITGLLSPVGKVFTRSIDKTNKRCNYEQVVVEDLPQYIDRITEYVLQSDQPPRQVLVEARVLQVRLGKDTRHGVNLEGLINQAGPEVWLKTQAFASPTGSGAVFSVDGSRFNQLLDILNTTTDAKTLAAPKVLMINGQESRIQIGQRLAYITSTTTQTVTVQGVNFLDVGVLLTVTPHITESGQIMMKINPKVSSGQINPANDLPEEETTELQSTVLVQDGAGIIIGGLIQETDLERQSKLPFLGDLWLVGRLFQRRSLERERAEVIIALLPRIVNCKQCLTPEEETELARTQLPLLTPELIPAPRPEPTLNDAIRKPVRSIKGFMQ